MPTGPVPWLLEDYALAVIPPFPACVHVSFSSLRPDRSPSIQTDQHKAMSSQSAVTHTAQAPQVGDVWVGLAWLTDTCHSVLQSLSSPHGEEVPILWTALDPETVCASTGAAGAAG